VYLKLLFVVFIFIKCFSFSQSDSVKTRDFRFLDEVYLGSNYTILNGKDARFGFNLGIGWDLVLYKNLKLDIGLEWSSKRVFKSSVQNSHFSDLQNVTYTLNGLYLPIDIGYYLGQKKLFYLGFGIFGEQYNLFKSFEKGTSSSFNPFTGIFISENVVQRADIASINYGLRFTSRIRIPIKNHYFVFKPIFTYSLMNIGRQSNSINTSNIQMAIGWQY
jgi:hypothetical protein